MCLLCLKYGGKPRAALYSIICGGSNARIFMLGNIVSWLPCSSQSFMVCNDCEGC